MYYRGAQGMFFNKSNRFILDTPPKSVSYASFFICPAAIVVYDITSHESFERAKQWIKELQRNGNPDIVIALAGNKLDLAEKRDVKTQEAQEYAEENGILFSETSAKTAANVNELFVAIGTLSVLFYSNMIQISYFG